MPLEGTEHWRSYITTAYQIGLPVILLVQVFQKGGSSSQVHVGVEGADEGEDEGGEEGEGGDAEENETDVEAAGVIDEGKENP